MKFQLWKLTYNLNNCIKKTLENAQFPFHFNLVFFNTIKFIKGWALMFLIKKTLKNQGNSKLAWKIPKNSNSQNCSFHPLNFINILNKHLFFSKESSKIILVSQNVLLQSSSYDALAPKITKENLRKNLFLMLSREVASALHICHYRIRELIKSQSVISWSPIESWKLVRGLFFYKNLLIIKICVRRRRFFKY